MSFSDANVLSWLWW